MSWLTRACNGIPATAVIVVALATGAIAEQPPERDEELLERMFTGDAVDVDWIAPSARRQLTPELIGSVVTRLRAAAGALQTVEPTGDRWELSFENGSTTVILSRDQDGRLTGLWVNELMPHDLQVEQVVEALAELEGETALLVVAGDEVLGQRNPDAALLVGSAFKLAVLAAARNAVDAGTLSWDDVVRLETERASLPTGMLQSYPDGHPLTIATLAAMMISISDNTATDALIELVGRDRVEAAAGIEPVLTTAEYFKLKADGELYRRYLAAGLPERRQILDELRPTDLPAVSMTANGRTAHGWRLPARALCDMMASVADLDVLTINPGNIGGPDWARVAFKGGSDVGVINVTYWLTPVEGTPICVTATWNGDAVDEQGFARLVTRLIHALRTGH